MEKKKLKLIIEIILFIVALGAITLIYYFTGNNEIDEEEMTNIGIVKITDNNFEEEIINSDKPVVLEFFSNSCPPCLTMVPTMINIAKNNDDVKVATVNTSEAESSETVKKYNIEAFPTIVIIKNGETKKTFIGATSEESIMKELK